MRSVTVSVMLIAAFVVAVALSIGLVNSFKRVETTKNAHCEWYGLDFSNEGPYMTAQCVDPHTGVVYDPEVLSDIALRRKGVDKSITRPDAAK